LAYPVLRVSREGAKLGCFDFIYLISEVMKNKENNGIKLKIKTHNSNHDESVRKMSLSYCAIFLRVSNITAIRPYQILVHFTNMSLT